MLDLVSSFSLLEKVLGQQVTCQCGLPDLAQVQTDLVQGGFLTVPSQSQESPCDCLSGLQPAGESCCRWSARKGRTPLLSPYQCYLCGDNHGFWIFLHYILSPSLSLFTITVRLQEPFNLFWPQCCYLLNSIHLRVLLWRMHENLFVAVIPTLRFPSVALINQDSPETQNEWDSIYIRLINLL